MRAMWPSKRNIYIGIGYHHHVTAEEMESSIRAVLEELGASKQEIEGLCTAEFKDCEELKRIASKLNARLFLFSREEINSLDLPVESKASYFLNIRGIAEPCALLAARRSDGKIELILRRSFRKRIKLVAVVAKKMG